MFLALVLSAATAVSVTEPISVFRQACMDGSARFKRESISDISAKQLPGAIRTSIPAKAKGRHFRLRGTAKPAFLSTYGGLGAEKNCQVAARGIDFETAVRAVSGQPLNLPQNANVNRLDRWSQKMLAGYQLDVWRAADGFLVMHTKTTAKGNGVQ